MLSQRSTVKGADVVLGLTWYRADVAQKGLARDMHAWRRRRVGT